jgi:hypothetical protein
VQCLLKKKIIIVEQGEFPTRDFTGGAAERLLQQLQANGAISVPSIREVMDKL